MSKITWAKHQKKIGLILLQISGYFILLGGIGDFTMSFYLNSLPNSHLRFLRATNESLSSEMKTLDFALLRAIGGCLMAIGIGILTIIYTCLAKNVKSALFGLLAMVTIGEGINFSQMLIINSPLNAYPLGCMLVAWIGGALWWVGNKNLNSDLQ